MTSALAEGLSPQQLIRATGMTYRQMDHWSRAGVFGPDVQDVGSGTRRRFPPAVVDAARAATSVARFFTTVGGSRAGATTELLAEIVDVVRREPVSPGEVLVITDRGVQRTIGPILGLNHEPQLVVPLRTDE